MKKVTAILRPNQLDTAKDVLTEVGCTGLTISEVKGFGRQRGHSEVYRGSEYVVEFQPKVMVETVMPDSLAGDAVRALVAATSTGQVGDGKIFVSTVEEVIRIRTGETGEKAIA